MFCAVLSTLRYFCRLGTVPENVGQLFIAELANFTIVLKGEARYVAAPHRCRPATRAAAAAAFCPFDPEERAVPCRRASRALPGGPCCVLPVTPPLLGFEMMLKCFQNTKSVLNYIHFASNTA